MEIQGLCVVWGERWGFRVLWNVGLTVNYGEDVSDFAACFYGKYFDVGKQDIGEGIDG